MGEAILGVLPFLVLLLGVLSIIIFVPWLTWWLPTRSSGPDACAQTAMFLLAIY